MSKHVKTIGIIVCALMAFPQGLLSQTYSKELERKANKGNAGAQCELGLCYLWGSGVQKDQEKAVDLFLQSAKQNNRMGQFWLAICFDTGTVLERNSQKAVQYYKRAADNGLGTAQSFLADHYRVGDGVERNLKEAYEWYKKAALQDVVPAQYHLGKFYEYGIEVSQDYSKAFEWYQKSAEKGEKDGIIEVGKCYLYGKGVKQNYNLAFECFQRINDNDEAMYYLGCLYLYGDGVANDIKEALRYFTDSADKGNTYSMTKLGIIYYEGRHGIQKDYTKAFKYLKLAAEDTDNPVGQAMNYLSACYYNERGVKENKAQGDYWRQKAAEHGDDDAQQILLQRKKWENEH